MSRPLRITYPGAWYHVMNRGLARNPIFATDDHRLIFLDLLAEIHDRYQAEIHAYCLMNNHYHLLIRTPQGNISRMMRHLNGIYTQRFNSTTNRDGPLFRGRYKSILVDADAYLLQLSRYIHLNPVQAKIVKKAEQFVWSSYRAYIVDVEPYWLNTQYTLSNFGNNSQKVKYKSFVEQGVDQRFDDSYKDMQSAPILGTEEFIKLVTERYLQDKHKIDEIPEHKLLMIDKPIDIETIVRCVLKFYGVNRQEINIIKTRGGNLPRIITIFLANTIGQYSFTQISSYICNITSSGASRACQRMQTRIKMDSKLKQDIEAIKKTLMDISIVQT